MVKPFVGSLKSYFRAGTRDDSPQWLHFCVLCYPFKKQLLSLPTNRLMSCWSALADNNLLPLSLVGNFIVFSNAEILINGTNLPRGRSRRQWCSDVVLLRLSGRPTFACSDRSRHLEMPPSGETAQLKHVICAQHTGLCFAERIGNLTRVQKQEDNLFTSLAW